MTTYVPVTDSELKRPKREYDEMVRLLRKLEEIPGDRDVPVNQLRHALQTAAAAAWAGTSDEMVVAALCHDVAKPLSLHNHARVGAELLRDYVSPSVYNALKIHGETVRHVRSGGSPPCPTPAWLLAEWDAQACDADALTAPLSAFLPYLRRIYGIDQPDQKEPE